MTVTNTTAVAVWSFFHFLLSFSPSNLLLFIKCFILSPLLTNVIPIYLDVFYALPLIAIHTFHNLCYEVIDIIYE